MIVSDLAAAACFAGMALVASSPGSAGRRSRSCRRSPRRRSGPPRAPRSRTSSRRTRSAGPNSLVAIGRNIGIMVGPAVGGILLAAVGAPWVFAINAASFVLSAALVVSVRASLRGRPIGRRTSIAGSGRASGSCSTSRCSDGSRSPGSCWSWGSGWRWSATCRWSRRVRRGVGRVRGDDRALGCRVDPRVPSRGAGSRAATEMRWLVLGTAFVACTRRRDRALAVVRARPGPERRLGSRPRGSRASPSRTCSSAERRTRSGAGSWAPSRVCSTVGWPSRSWRRRSCCPVVGSAGDVRDRRCGGGALGDRAAPAARRRRRSRPVEVDRRAPLSGRHGRARAARVLPG